MGSLRVLKVQIFLPRGFSAGCTSREIRNRGNNEGVLCRLEGGRTIRLRGSDLPQIVDLRTLQLPSSGSAVFGSDNILEDAGTHLSDVEKMRNAGSALMTAVTAVSKGSAEDLRTVSAILPCMKYGYNLQIIQILERLPEPTLLEIQKLFYDSYPDNTRKHKIEIIRANNQKGFMAPGYCQDRNQFGNHRRWYELTERKIWNRVLLSGVMLRRENTWIDKPTTGGHPVQEVLFAFEKQVGMLVKGVFFPSADAIDILFCDYMSAHSKKQ